MRADAQRARTTILATAAAERSAGRPLQLNAVAAAAGVGVGTVYRHFPGLEQLTEALVLARFGELEALAQQALEDHSRGRVPAFFARALDAIAADPDFRDVAMSASCALDETDQARRGLIESVHRLLDDARLRGDFRSGFSATEILALVCGVAYGANRLRASRDRSQALLAAALDGVQDQRT